MRPGLAEIIEHYRRCVERGEPLISDPNNPIPMLPGQDNALRKIEAMESTNLERAIDLLTSDDATKQIDDQITQLEAKLSRLKKLQRALGGNKSNSRVFNFKIDEELERKIVAYVKKHGPCLPGVIAKQFSMAPINVGRLVAASEVLAKRGSNVVLAEGK